MRLVSHRVGLTICQHELWYEFINDPRLQMDPD